MNFLHILAIFAVLTVVFACVRVATYRYQSRRWRREHRNFRVLRAADVAAYALPKSAKLATMAWITATCLPLACLIFGATAGNRFQRRLEE